MELTFGLPVVPLDVHRKATFVLPSPGESLRSMKEVGCVRPSFTRSCTVTNEAEPFDWRRSMRMTRSAGILHCLEAARAVSMLSGWTTNTLQPVIFS